MVATDVAARGLHIPDVDMVVQYQLPPTADTYIHRAGRTARAGAEGVCVSVVVPDESERFSRLHVALGQKAPQQFPMDSKVLEELRTHARLAKRIDALENVNSKANADRKWMQRQSVAIGEPPSCALHSAACSTTSICTYKSLHNSVDNFSVMRKGTSLFIWSIFVVS